MKLTFRQKKYFTSTGDVYGRTDVELAAAVSAALTKINFSGDKDYNNAYRAILDAFHNGMGRGYGGQDSDEGRAEVGDYVTEAFPQTGTFHLYKKIV